MKKLVRKKRRKNSRRAELIIILVVLLSVGITVFLRSEFFAVENIIVEGNKRVDSQTIINTGNITLGMNIFSLNADKTQDRINQITMIKNTSVVKKYPDEVSIIVTEKTAFLTVVEEGKYYAMDEKGCVIYSSDELNEDCGILFSGLSDIEYLVGNTYDFKSSAKTATAFEVAEWLRTSGYSNMVSEIYASPGGYYYLYTNRSNVIKFYSLDGFRSNLEFIELFLENEDRHIMVEVVEGSEPVYKVININ